MNSLARRLARPPAVVAAILSLASLASLALAGAVAAAGPARAASLPGAEAPAATRGEPQRAVRLDRPERRMFGNVSPEGRTILSDALRSSRPEDRAQLKAARDRITALIAAEPLDMAALRKAMAEERRIADEQHARRQAALLAAIGRLSPADRKAFAEDALRGRRMAEARAEEWRRWAEEYRRRMKDMPPLPPLPPGAFPPALPAPPPAPPPASLPGNV